MDKWLLSKSDYTTSKKLSVFSVEESEDKLILCLDTISLTGPSLVNAFRFPDGFVTVKSYVCYTVL